jgi:hypothetical protein
MSVESFWISKTFVVEWKVVDLEGAPVSATVAGIVTKPDGNTAAMVMSNPATGTYRATFDPTEAGTHAYRLTANGGADGAEEGSFYVRPSLTGAAPIELDPSTDVGQVRLLIADVDEGSPLFTDAQIAAFLSMNGGKVRRGAAQALDVIAGSEVLVSKKIRTQDLATDGPAVAKELRAMASELRRQEDNAEGDDEASGFEIAEFTPYHTPPELAGY